MLVDIINFLFVYAISGLILSVIIYSFFKKNTDKKFSLILGYGIAPLLISLILCYLYYLFPHKTWSFYALSIYSLFLLLLVRHFKQTVSFLKINYKATTKNFEISIKNSNLLSKIMFFFIFFVVLFSFVRGSVYPTTWFDSFSYLRQGYIYSQDRSHDRLKTKLPFTAFNNNKIAPPPIRTYTMDTAIRPALPILYSFFFKNTMLSETEYFSTRFVYFYYFLLAIFALYYYLKKYKSHALIGVCIFTSCFYTLAFGPILNAKEIILLFLSFFSVMLIGEMKEASDYMKLKYAIIVGILIGLGIFINLSGIIIGGIIFLLLIKELGIKKRAITLALTVALAIAVFSGFEVKSTFTYVFNKNLISAQNTSETFKSPEMKSYKIASDSETQSDGISKLNILLMGKLQGITQIQFYGIIFVVFLATLFITVKKRFLSHISKNILLYMGLFFFIVMDPFFLNPHDEAYVLSISPKYTVLLTIFAAFFVAYHFNSLTKIWERESRKFFLKLSGYFLFIFSIASLVSPLRKIFVNISYFFLSRIIPIYNAPDYYFRVLNNLILLAAVLYIAFFLLFYAFKKFDKLGGVSLSSIISAVIVAFFILPNLFLLNSNYNVYGTLSHTFYPNNAAKAAAATNSKKEKQLLEMINYINTNIENEKTILFSLMQSTPYYNAWYFINNSSHLKILNTDSLQNIGVADYLLLNKIKLSGLILPENIMQIRETSDYVLYKVN